MTMRGRRRREVVVRGFGAGAPTGIVIFGPLVLACALGRSGRRVLKREGDGATPVGRWAVREVFYRPDRIRRPQTRLKVSPIRPRDGWCDAPGDRNYNRAVTLPYAASAETPFSSRHSGFTTKATRIPRGAPASTIARTRGAW